ncbi:MAG: 50S ribosomal protein L5 [Deltaproteobacteria bacterium]|nr:50S ribosomal protein L5 [Deltaproteobacteria bacterium]
MADTNEKAPKGEKPEKAEKAEKTPKSDKAQAPKKEKGKKGGGEPVSVRARPPARLMLRYKNEIRPALKQQLGLENVYEVPQIEKVVLNMGLGDAITNNKVLDAASEELARITGQKAVVTRSRKSISNFKLRENMPIGAMVTLRGPKMWEFLDRLISLALPRVRDFKGVSDKAFDGRGNYTLGLKEQIIFPEIEYDKVEKIRGMNICIVTTATNDEHGKALLQAIGVPMWKRTAQAEKTAQAAQA